MKNVTSVCFCIFFKPHASKEIPDQEEDTGKEPSEKGTCPKKKPASKGVLKRPASKVTALKRLAAASPKVLAKKKEGRTGG